MKLCLGCAHCEYEEGSDYSYSEYTSGHDNAYFKCKKQHWINEMGYSADLPTLEEKLLLANTCPDFKERT